MRFLLVNNHCITDPTAGVTQSLRTIMQWLAEAGHACHILTTARFESPVAFTIEEHLHERGVDVPEPTARTDDPMVHFTVGGVPVTMMLTRHNDEARPNPRETAQFGAALRELLDAFAPDQLIACNAHPMIQSAMAAARKRGVTTAFAVRGFGYYHPRYFEHVNHAFTCSEFLTNLYRQKVGLASTPIHPPIDWSTVVAPMDARAFVTFVHPAPHKGLFLFARLADMLGSRRSDIPILVVQSGHSGGALNALPGIDFRQYPQIMAAPAVPTPAEYFALTRILLVPSVWEEPFGRVAAEAMINGVPALVSDRGSLPQVIGGDFSSGGAGRVLRLPEWMTFTSRKIPGEREVEHWYDAVCGLWDDAELYERVAARGREMAARRYSEAVSREQHVNYFTSREPGATVFATPRD